jgi:hypothetical protein
MNFDLVEVLTRAWKITWKHRVLWLFGMLASCGRSSSSGNSGGNNNQSGFSNGEFSSEGPFSEEMVEQMAQFFERVATWFSDHPVVIIAIILFFIFAWILQIFLTVNGSIGLIRGAHLADTDVERIHFGSLFGESLRYFWRVIGLGLTVFLPVVLIFIAFFFLLIASIGSAPNSMDSVLAGSSILFLTGLCCCLFPLMIVLGLYYGQALRALVLEDLGVFASLSRVWPIFKANIGGLLLTAVIIFIINLIVGVIVAIPIYIVIFPILFKFIGEGFTSWQPFIIAGTFVLCYSPIAWFLNGILTTYTETIWTLIYLRVTQPKVSASSLPQANA